LPKTHAETDFLNYMPGEFQMTVEQEQEFIRDFGAGGLGLLILAQVDSRIVGIAGAASPRFQRLSHHAELGITVLAEFWGLTVGRALMQALLNWGRLRGLHKMYLRVFEENRRAIALYESLGFAAEARLRDDVRRADGSLGDTLIMSKFYVG
jgi:RimJ/RimL family protein N-acetyltransferase